jgi:hypothetical protein
MLFSFVANDTNVTGTRQYQEGTEYFEDEASKSKWLENQKLHLEELSKNIEKLAFENFSATRKFYNNFYVSYEEYIEALRNGDCYSPFEHTQGDVSVFGIYYHS